MLFRALGIGDWAIEMLLRALALYLTDHAQRRFFNAQPCTRYDQSSPLLGGWNLYDDNWVACRY